MPHQVNHDATLIPIERVDHAISAEGVHPSMKIGHSPAHLVARSPRLRAPLLPVETSRRRRLGRPTLQSPGSLGRPPATRVTAYWWTLPQSTPRRLDEDLRPCSTDSSQLRRQGAMLLITPGGRSGQVPDITGQPASWVERSHRKAHPRQIGGIVRRPDQEVGHRFTG